MKVLLINGSPHKKGCTHTALTEIAATLERHAIETKIFFLGTKPVSECLGCNKCADTGKCSINDIVNVFLDEADEFDGYIFGSPVHFASASGTITSFMDRVFYAHRRYFANKPVASVVSCRRGGASSTFDQLNKYYMMSNMPVVTSQYWNMVHGNTPEEVKQDIEGLQTMRTLANNMAWLLKCIEAGKNAGLALPENEKWHPTNFIR